MENQSPTGPNRRNVVVGIAAVSVGVPLMAACAEKTSSAPTAKAGSVLTKTSAVPVGGGVVLTGANVVVTQPTAGSFNCFTATCTHEGCQVGSVANGNIICPCHGSEFSIATGDNVVGPGGQAAGSIAPLAKESISVAGDEIRLGATSSPSASGTPTA